MEPSGDRSRVRIKIACEECRKNKRKCDGQKPACYLCKKFARECLYASEQSRKRRHYDEDLVRNLENQIKILESALKSRSANVPSTVSMSECEAVNAPPQDSQDNLVREDESALSCPDSRNDDFRSSAAMEELATLMLEMDIAEGGEPSFTMAPGKRQPALSDLEAERKMEPMRSDERIAIHLLPPELLIHLVDCFVTHFNPYHQFLDRQDVADLKRQGIDVDALDLRFRNAALLAVAACFSSIPEAKKLRSSYASLADGLAFRCIRERPNDIVVQGLTLLAWKELMFGAPSLAYNYIAMATGQILHLGLHVTALAKTPDGVIVDQVLYKRRVRSFWAYFSVDRLLTSSLGMNCTMHWQRVRLHPFSTILDAEPTLDEAAHDTFCQLWHLWDSSMDQVYAFGWAQLTSSERESLVLRSHQSLTDFSLHIDDRLRLRRDYLPDGAVWFQMAYHTALLLIHRPLLNEPRGSSALAFALRSTTASAASISRIIRSYRRSRQRFESLAPQVVDYILAGAVIHLLNATAGKTPLGRQSASGLRSCIDALDEFRARWAFIATRALAKITELAHQWKVAWALPIHLARPIETPTDLGRHGSSASSSSSPPVLGAGTDADVESAPSRFTNHHGVAIGANVAELASSFNFQHGNNPYHHQQPRDMMGDEDEHTFWNLNDCFWDELVAEQENDAWMVRD